jgi:hypothetical protein
MNKFWLCPPNNIVCVDDAPETVNLSAIAKNIYLVRWQSDNYGNGEGSILYSDRLGVRDPLTDVTPYLPYINLWILAAQSDKDHPITLAQARWVKLILTNMLFTMKNTAPCATAYGTVAADPESVSNMQSQALVDNASNDQNLGSQVNNALDTSTVTTQTTTTTTTATLTNTTTSTTLSGTPVDTATSVSGSTSTSNSDSNSVSASQFYPAHVTPNSPSPTTNILQSIMNRRNSLMGVKGAHFSNLNNTITVPGIAAYDITTGW